jgi:hypothetical protein
MPERKYARYIVTESNLPPPPPEAIKRMEEQRAQGNYAESTHMFSLSDVVAKGAFYVDCVWMWDRNNPQDLGAVLDFYLGDEQYIIDKSCIVFIPRGLSHGPCGMKRIDRPLLFITMGNGTSYTRSSGNE